MRFLLLIVEPRGQRGSFPPAEARNLYDQMMAYGQNLQEEGRLIAAESLRPDEHGVRLSARGSPLALRDGPFAEAREMVGGFFLIEAADRDEAVAVARRCPAVAWATVEVRECAPCYVG